MDVSGRELPVPGGRTELRWGRDDVGLQQFEDPSSYWGSGEAWGLGCKLTEPDLQFYLFIF